MPQIAEKKKRTTRTSPPPDVMDLAAAARFLQLPAKTVKRLVTEQGLPGRQNGKEWRFLRAAIERWLEPAQASSGTVLDQAGMFASDADFAQFQRIIEENRQRWNKEVA